MGPQCLLLSATALLPYFQRRAISKSRLTGLKKDWITACCIEEMKLDNSLMLHEVLHETLQKIEYEPPLNKLPVAAWGLLFSSRLWGFFFVCFDLLLFVFCLISKRLLESDSFFLLLKSLLYFFTTSFLGCRSDTLVGFMFWVWQFGVQTELGSPQDPPHWQVVVTLHLPETWSSLSGFL